MLDKSVSLIKFFEWSVCTKTYTVKGYELERELTPLNYKILIYFICNPKRIITRDELIDAVWENTYVDDNAINKAISDLRRALKADNAPEYLIKTHYKKGYSFNSEVELIQQNKPAVAVVKSEPTVQSVPSSEQQTYFYQKAYELAKQRPIIIWVIILFAFFIAMSVWHKIPAKTQVLSLNAKKLSISESVYLSPLLSPSRNTLAISKQHPEFKKEEIFLVNLETYKNTKVISEKYDVYAVGWSQDSRSLYYQIISVKDSFCEVWRADINSQIQLQQKELVFTCNSNDFLSLVTDEENNSVIYTKFGYRGVASLAALVKRDLATGEEFQVTSPNIESFGERFVALSPSKRQIAFIRVSGVGSQIFIAQLDGSRQEMIFDSKEVIYRLAWSETGDELLWFNKSKHLLNRYSLQTKQLNSIKVEHNESLRMVVPTKDKLYATTRILDKDIVKLSVDYGQLNSIATSEDEELLLELTNHGSYFLKQSHNISLHKIVNGQGLPDPIMEFELDKLTASSINQSSPFIALANEGQLSIYDFADKSEQEYFEVTGQIIFLHWLDEEQLLLIKQEDGFDEQNLWRININEGVESIQKIIHRNVKKVVSISPSLIVYQDNLNNFYEFDLLRAEEKRLFSVPELSSIRWDVLGEDIYISNRLAVFKLPLQGGERTLVFDVTNIEPQSIISDIKVHKEGGKNEFIIELQRVKLNSVILLE